MKRGYQQWMAPLAGAVLTVLASIPAQAIELPSEQSPETPSAGMMVTDALIGRPLLLVTTVAGTAIFLVSAPFAALGGNLGDAAEVLVKTPAEATFRRCLGCKVSRRADEM